MGERDITQMFNWIKNYTKEGDMKMETFGCVTLCIAVTTFSQGCTSLVPGNPASNWRANEVVKVSIKKDKDKEELRTVAGEKSLAVAAVAIPFAVDFAVTRTVSELKKEADRYSASWSGFVVADGFYKKDPQGKPTTDVAVQKVFVERFVGGDKEPAFRAVLAVKQSDDAFAFQLVPSSVMVNKSKAKLTRWDKNVDIDMEIRIEALYSQGATATLMDIGSLNIPLRGVEIGKPWTNANDTIQSQWFPAVPASRSADGKKLGTGNFVIKVIVREYDDFGEKVKGVAEYIDKNKDKITDQVKQ